MSHNPFSRFGEVYERAQAIDRPLTDGFALATVDAAGQPSVRTMLLKGFDEDGFVFYTNTLSRKGEELATNPKVALCFWWPEMQEQIRIAGDVQPVSDEEADAYFATRPRGSQVGAWASNQSEVLQSREQLLKSLDEHTAKFEGGDVPRPPHWSGFRVLPQRFEFWIGKEDRLHERYLYTRDGDSWQESILAP